MKKIALTFLLLCTFAFNSFGASNPIKLCGKVSEIIDGDTFVFRSNIVATLQHIDSPEEGQPYNEIAKKHLADLILGKEICFYLNQIDDNENLWIGDAYGGQMNVGRQMVRDGVAWYNDSNNSLLDELDQRLFLESEQAARTERRGIWQDPTPVAPWDYRRLNAAKFGLDTSLVTTAGNTYGNQSNNSSAWKTVYVRDYYRTNGTHVNSYWRSAAGTNAGSRTSGRSTRGTGGHSSGGGRSGGRH